MASMAYRVLAKRAKLNPKTHKTTYVWEEIITAKNFEDLKRQLDQRILTIPLMSRIKINAHTLWGSIKKRGEKNPKH
jgi:hypothetical protein